MVLEIHQNLTLLLQIYRNNLCILNNTLWSVPSDFTSISSILLYQSWYWNVLLNLCTCSWRDDREAQQTLTKGERTDIEGKESIRLRGTHNIYSPRKEKPLKIYLDRRPCYVAEPGNDWNSFTATINNRVTMPQDLVVNCILSLPSTLFINCSVRFYLILLLLIKFKIKLSFGLCK